jgi:phosphatidylglycerophosphatase A
MSRTPLSVIVATFGGVGFFPVAPGTAGSAAALLVFALARWSGSRLIELGLLVIISAVGVWSAGEAERALGGSDPGPIVIDEVAGMLLTLALVPVSPTGVAIGFVLFRLFDIIKPYPCGRLERLGGGAGIMADDLMAGIYGNLALRALAFLIPALR